MGLMAQTITGDFTVIDGDEEEVRWGWGGYNITTFQPFEFSYDKTADGDNDNWQDTVYDGGVLCYTYVFLAHDASSRYKTKQITTDYVEIVMDLGNGSLPKDPPTDPNNQ